MILYYAMGGGLGHLTRARAVLHTLGVRGPVALVSASAHSRDPRVTGGLPVLAPPAGIAPDPVPLARWLRGLLAQWRPDTLYLDAFPGGIVGEWCNFPFPSGLRRVHLARLLRWPAYRARLTGPLPRFDISYRLEPLDPEHTAALGACSSALVDLRLDYFQGSVESIENDDGGETWLVVHSGPEEEVLDLLAYAREARLREAGHNDLILVSPRRPTRLPEAVRWRDTYPAMGLMDQASRIITACGFNVMEQTRAHRPRHRFIPFPRPLDDQFQRARRHREGMCVESSW